MVSVLKLRMRRVCGLSCSPIVIVAAATIHLLWFEQRITAALAHHNTWLVIIHGVVQCVLTERAVRAVCEGLRGLLCVLRGGEGVLQLLKDQNEGTTYDNNVNKSTHQVGRERFVSTSEWPAVRQRRWSCAERRHRNPNRSNNHAINTCLVKWSK